MLNIIFRISLLLSFLWGNEIVFAQSGDYYSIIERALDRQEQGGRATRPDKSPILSSTIDSREFSTTDTRDYLDEFERSRRFDPKRRVSLKDKIILDVLDLEGMDINDVLKLIAKKSGLNIVAGKNIAGKVTIYLKEVDVADALRIILESHDMAFVEEDNIVKVMMDKDYELTYGHKFEDKTAVRIVQLKYANATEIMATLNQMRSIIGKIIADQKSNTLVLMDTPEKLAAMEFLLEGIDVPVKTETFHLSYTKAEDITPKIIEAITKNVGMVNSDKRTNKIIVTDTPQKLDEIRNLVSTFDTQQREVSIEAKIIQVVLSDQYKMGIDWQAIVADWHGFNWQSDLDVLGGDTTAPSDKRGKVSIGTLSSDDYTILLEALQTVGTTNILSSPRITVLNNEEAKILVGSTEPFVTTTTTTPATGAATTAESVNFIDVGVKLFVTPTIHNDDFITMKVKPEVSTVTRFLTTSQNNTIPVVETSEAETTVMVKDGVTIVIGGLIKDEKIDTRKRVPVLANVPLLGALFRNRDDLVRKTELVIFLTPRIISGDASENQRVSSLKY